MRFGLFFLPVGESAPALYARVFAECRAADDLGYDHVWFAEHHCDRYGGVFPATSVICAAVAAQTTRIRIGPAIAVVPLQDPFRLAEQFAMVDVISDGRLEMGLGRGFMLHEFERCGVPWETRDARFDEGVETLLAAWDPDRGIEGRPLLPRPRQSPPPVWIAASLNRASFELAGSRGFGLMINPYTRTAEELARGLGWYRDAARQAGHSPESMRVMMHSHLYLADSEADARETPREALLEYLGEVDRAYRIGHPEQQRIAGYDYEEMYPRKVLFGTAETIELRLREWERIGVTDFCFMTSFGSLPDELSMRTIHRFAARVRPRVREAAA